MKSLNNKTRAALVIALILHLALLCGILYFKVQIFVKVFPVYVTLLTALVFFTQEKLNIPFFIFFFGCAALTWAAEATGVSGGGLFGEYAFGPIPGPSVANAPFAIGLFWFIVIFCCGTAVHLVLEKLTARLTEMTGEVSKTVRLASVVTDGAMLLVFFDWILQPAAGKLDLWHWTGSGVAPLYNYVCRLVLAALLITCFSLLRFNKRSPFAVFLIMIMLMFFLLVRTFV